MVGVSAPFFLAYPHLWPIFFPHRDRPGPAVAQPGWGVGSAPQVWSGQQTFGGHASHPPPPQRRRGGCPCSTRWSRAGGTWRCPSSSNRTARGTAGRAPATGLVLRRVHSWRSQCSLQPASWQRFDATQRCTTCRRCNEDYPGLQWMVRPSLTLPRGRPAVPRQGRKEPLQVYTAQAVWLIIRRERCFTCHPRPSSEIFVVKG